MPSPGIVYTPPVAAAASSADNSPVLRDVVANRPSASGQNRLFYGTDTGLLYAEGASTWTTLTYAYSALSGLPTLGTASSHNTGDFLLAGATAVDSSALGGVAAASYATLTGNQTLTNKTLTSPAVNSPTGIVKGDVGLGNVDNTSDATKNSATATLTNKRVTRRITSLASSATPTVNTDATDLVIITALAAAITSMTTNLTGTPSDGDKLEYRIKDNGTARAITWGASFEAVGFTPPTTTVISKRLIVLFEWDAVTSKWGCISIVMEQ